MIHCAGLTFPGLRKSLSKVKHENAFVPSISQESQKTELVEVKPSDIIIRADQLQHLPAHFVHTLERLDLNIFISPQPESL